MKRKSIISLLILSMGVGMFTTSCEDMLSPNSERHSYVIAQDTLYSYWGILKSLQNVAEKYVILGECRGDLVQGTGTVSDTINAIMNFGLNGYQDKVKDGSSVYTCAADYYHIINSCNAYLADADTVRTTGTDDKYMMGEYAQVEAIRAWTYMQLVQVYGEVPFYTEPLLTTDKINSFINDPNCQKANASNLADLLEDKLLFVEPYQQYGSEGFEQYIYPQYETYGYTKTVCDATKCMFPVSVVLADLYLMKGGSTDVYAKAAQHYYNFLNTQTCGPLISNNFYSYGDVRDSYDNPFYYYKGNPYNEPDKASKTTESITCIPSNSNKNWGTVLRDINRLFGYTATISVGTNGSSETASISLTRDFDRELIASKGYEALCDSQKYEAYIGTVSDGELDKNNAVLTVLPDVGDTRRSWVREYTKKDGEETIYGRFVDKQNAYGESGFYTTGSNSMRSTSTAFSSVYPVLYRKAGIWLRYAEAVNRAGFPGYAFAVLRNGLCNNDEWLPDPDGLDYAIKDTIFNYVMDLDPVHPDTLSNTDYDALIAEATQKYIDAGKNATYVKQKNVFYTAESTYNYPADESSVACYYISKPERVRANATPYLNFKTNNMCAAQSTLSIQSKTDIYAVKSTFTTYPKADTSGDKTKNITTGIHARGCGRICHNERNTVFNYVDQVAAKVQENHGKTLSKEEIYSGDYDDLVQEAIEDLIIDEMGLELAFEGSRFFDLSRVALRRNDPSFFAKHLALRNGTFDQSLYSQLLNTKNWYLPLPEVE